MKNSLLNSTKEAVKYWWVSLFVGLLAIGLGIWCAATPLSTMVALSLVFAVSFFVGGLFEIIFAISNRRNINGWGWTLVSGIIDFIFGAIMIALPIDTAFVLVYFIGFWIMFQSIWAIGVSCELQRNDVKGWGVIMILAILGIILSFIFIISPIFGGSVIVIFVSLAFISYGIARVYYAIKLRNLHNLLDEKED